MGFSAISLWNSLQPKSRTSARVLITGLGRLIANFSAQLRIIRLLRQPGLRFIASQNPRLYFKHLSRTYLFNAISTRAAAACLHHHYTQMNLRFNENFLRRVMLDRAPVFEIEESGHCFTIKMGAPRDLDMDMEGEMSLELFVDGQRVFSLCFSIVPGWVVGSRQEDVILISRLQGVRGRFDEISLATKALSDVCPSALLVAALVGFATSFSVREFFGVSANRQICYGTGRDERFKQVYDKFFEDIGAAETPDGFFRLSVPLPEKPMNQVKRGHRLRTVRKRAFKRSVAKSVDQALCLHLRHQCPESLQSQWIVLSPRTAR